MIPQKIEANQVEMIGTQRSNDYTIKFDAFLADLLSTKIYNYPIRAVIRETMTNAYDANVEAGRGDEPINVHLPTPFEPWFSVRDHGEGLCLEDLMGLFTTYGESTRRTTNTVTGGFGLGSKAPFAYVETNPFTVTSVHDGRKIVISCVKQDDGMPTANLQLDVPSNEPSGLLVQVPVAKEDFQEFKREAAHVSMFFQSEIEGFEFEKLDVAYEADGWKLVAGLSDPYVRMGNVGYKIKAHMKDGDQNIWIPDGLVMEFDIGDLSIPPSREEIRYDKNSEEKIIARYREIKAQAVQIAQEEISKQPTLLDAYVLKRSLEKLPGVGDAKLMYGDTVLNSMSMYINDLPNWISCGHLTSYDLSKSRRPSMHFRDSVSFSAYGDDVVVVIDEGTRWFQRIQHNQYDFGYADPRFTMVYVKDDKTKAEIAEVLHVPENIVHFISEFEEAPKPEYTRKPSTAPKLGKVYKHNGYVGTYHPADNWEEAKVEDYEEGGYYLRIRNWHAEFAGNEAESIGETVNILKKLGLIDDDTLILGIRHNMIDKVKKDDRFISLDDLAKREVQKRFVKNKTMMRQISNHKYFRGLHHEFRSMVSFVDSNVTDAMMERLSARHPLKKIKDFFNILNSRDEETSLSYIKIQSLAMSYEIDLKLRDLKPTHDLEKLFDQLDPVLKSFVQYGRYGGNSYVFEPYMEQHILKSA